MFERPERVNVNFVHPRHSILKASSLHHLHFPFLSSRQCGQRQKLNLRYMHFGRCIEEILRADLGQHSSEEIGRSKTMISALHLKESILSVEQLGECGFK